MVCVASFLSPGDAQLAQGLLESAQIPSYLGNEHTLNVDPAWVIPVGGYQLMVSEDLADDAHQVLNSRISDADLAAQSEQAGPSGE